MTECSGGSPLVTRVSIGTSVPLQEKEDIGPRLRLHEYLSKEHKERRVAPKPHERREVALSLFNRFYRQIRVGCTNPACNTPTCLSCQKRCAKGPFRRFTKLSARALASFLACEENAVQKLCPHPHAESIGPYEYAFPRGQLGTLPLLRELRMKCRQNIHETCVTAEAKPTSEVKPATAAATNANNSPRTELHNKADMGEMNSNAGQENNGMRRKATRPRTHDECPKDKDPKSLIQNVFDTQSFKISELVEHRDGCYRVHERPGSWSKLASRSLAAARLRRVIPNENNLHAVFSTLWGMLDYAYPRTESTSHTVAYELERAEGAAEIISYIFTALDRSLCGVRSVKQPAWQLFVSLHRSGQLVPNRKENRNLAAIAIDLMDHFEDEPAIRVMIKLTRAYAARRCWSEVPSSRDTQVAQPSGAAAVGFSRFVRDIMMDIVSVGTAIPSLNPRSETPGTSSRPVSGGVSYAAVILEWLRSVILHEWDGKAIIDKYGAVGGAVQLMFHLYEWRDHLNMSSDVFSMPFLADRLNPMDVPVEWASWQPAKETTHLLAFPFLFEPATLVTYFRAINYGSMVKKFEDAFAMSQLIARMVHVAGDSQLPLHNKLKIATSNYLVLEIRRGNILKDAMDQLWKRQKRELLRPLKVRMGMDEGEEGVDHGGVQQEFFRLAFSEALNPDYGMFTTDPRTQMSWFKPCTLEPSYRFELLGLLASLAIYNGLTLPVTFPLALYRKLLGYHVHTREQIQDGWPDLAKGLSDLLTWSEGDVADVFMRSYVFSVETADGVIHIDMERVKNRLVWPPELRTDQTDFLAPMPKSPPLSNGSTDDWVSLHNSDPSLSDSDFTEIPPANERAAHESPSNPASYNVDDAAMVTNENRDRYVDDYICWLTDRSILPQYEAFARGFYLCFDKKALSIFSPEALRNVVEGSQDIDLQELEMVTKYENGFSSQHRVIGEFWHVVRGFSKEQVRKLLEFVTASDRIPVKGVSSMIFVIQRNGNNDERLPTSLTCFGRLLLPEYSSEKKLRERLCLAIENSRGFGVA